MTSPVPSSGPELRSLVTADATLRLSIEEVRIGLPAPDELIVRVEGAPLNPSDLGLLLAAVNPANFQSSDGARHEFTAPIAPASFERLGGRVGQSLTVGLEGMGVVVAAGREQAGMIGRTVAMVGGGMYARYRRIAATSCMVLPDGTSPASGAGSFVNPMTALSIVETMRREGHRALVHTAAASNLGQMLVRICNADGIGLVNIVRSPAQAALLEGLGASHIYDSSAPDFSATLTEAIAATGATIAFDAVGGGDLASKILASMETAASRGPAPYSRYGSTARKQVYFYGGLDPDPIVLRKDFGMAWTAGGWLLFPALEQFGETVVAAMKARVIRELDTVFASNFTRSISLAELLQPQTLAAAYARSTGTKFLVEPQL